MTSSSRLNTMPFMADPPFSVSARHAEPLKKPPRSDRARHLRTAHSACCQTKRDQHFTQLFINPAQIGDDAFGDHLCCAGKRRQGGELRLGNGIVKSSQV